MNNIATLAKNDFKRMFSNVMSVIITIGLIVTPSIFSWYNILACWDVFGNTDKLKVAVANTDEGYKGDLLPMQINIGDQVIGELRANDQIGWVFTDKNDAIDGVKSGKYYAALVIPEDFSRDMFTFYLKDAQHASVVYYSNDKKNAIAPKVTGQGADAVSYQVNQVFAEKMSEMGLLLASALSSGIEENDLDGKFSVFANHIQSVGDSLGDTAGLVRLYSSVLSSASDATGEIEGLADNIKDGSESVSGSFEATQNSIQKAAKRLRSSISSMRSQFDGASEAISEMEKSMNTIFDESASNASAAASALRNQANSLSQKSQEYRNLAGQLNDLKGALPESAAGAIDSACASLNSIAQIMEDAQKNLNSAASKLEGGVSDVSAERKKVSDSLEEVKGDIAELKKSIDEDIGPAANDVAQHAEDLASTLGGALDDIFAQDSDLVPSAVVSGTKSASKDVSNLAKSLDSSSKKLGDLATRMNNAIASKDMEALRQLLLGDVQGFAKALAAPVQMERVEVFPVANFGSAMTPLYSTLALFIGSLLIMVAVRPTICKAEMRKLNEPKPHQLFFGRFAMVAFTSLAQTTLMALGNMLFLQVQVDSPMLFMVCYWVAGLVFSFIIYSLVSAFANLGKAVAVIMLIVQVTGCGGSFPIQMLPQFVQALSPWLPATYVVNAMRAAMFGSYGNDFWIAIGSLLLFLIPAALIGLVLKKPLSKFMRLYVAKVEESGLMA